MWIGLTYCTHSRSRRTSLLYLLRLLRALVAASRTCASSFRLACVLYCSCVHLMYLQACPVSVQDVCEREIVCERERERERERGARETDRERERDCRCQVAAEVAMP